MVGGRLYLVRHGQTAFNKDGKMAGVTDLDLNDHGRLQARRMADYLADAPIDTALVSPLSRARETARIVLEGRSLSDALRIEPGLIEMNFGEWEGLSFADIYKRNPELMNVWINDPEKFAFPGGEEFTGFYKRVVDCYETIIEPEMLGGKNVLAVTHGGVVLCISIYLLGLPLTQFFKLRVDNGRVTAFDVHPSYGRRCVALNAGPRLPKQVPIPVEKR